ncbi:MAG: response regulator transcription factor [Alphaproteobacteria bacterium]|nr:response regulator transcription factor [Alphaproteobacteria bacterium]HRW29343.1 response regulator transcription factor [Emcibacteraceae bacterium]
MRTLLVEDDHMIGDIIVQSLKDNSFAVDWVRDGQTALDSLINQEYDLILLDLGLPGKNGFEVLHQIRTSGNYVSLLILTAKDSIEDRIKGLDAGADDYVIKPFDMTELLARIRAVLRRKNGSASPLLTTTLITLDPATHEVSVDESLPHRLSSREFSLLYTLMLRPGAILSRQELEERVYGWGEEVESNAIEFIIHSIRKKIGATVIQNVRGVGWMVAK